MTIPPSMDDMDKRTKALNYWDLKVREKELQHELDAIHQAMDEVENGEQSVNYCQVTPYCD